MEVLEKGSPDVFYKKRCENCNSLLKFNEADESYQITYTYFGTKESRWIKCPECKHKINTVIFGNRIAKRWYPND